MKVSACFVMIAMALAIILATLTPQQADCQEKVWEKTIVGRIDSITLDPLVPLKGVLIIKDFWRREHTVYIGYKTVYIPRQPPKIGDRVEVGVTHRKGVWAAISIKYK